MQNRFLGMLEGLSTVASVQESGLSFLTFLDILASAMDLFGLDYVGHGS